MAEEIAIRTEEELGAIRRSCQVAARILQELVQLAQPGVTTQELERVARSRIRHEGAEPAFLGYEDFPATLCASVNSTAVHGNPSPTPLRAGDVLGLDFGVVLDGWYSDVAITKAVGQVSRDAARLIAATSEALERGIAQARVGNHVGDISAAIQKHLESEGFSVIRELVGHGVGRKLHEPPQVPNYGKPGEGAELKAGMVLAIEPIASVSSQHVKQSKDGFGYETDDRSLAAHFEHTVAITKDGPEVLTLP